MSIQEQIDKLEIVRQHHEEKQYSVEEKIDELQKILDNPPRIMDMSCGDEIKCPEHCETEDDVNEWIEEMDKTGIYMIMEEN